MKLEDIEIRTIEKLELKKGEVLAVYVETILSEVQVEKIKQIFLTAFAPLEIKIVVLHGHGIRLQALRAETE